MRTHVNFLLLPSNRRSLICSFCCLCIQIAGIERNYLLLTLSRSAVTVHRQWKCSLFLFAKKLNSSPTEWRASVNHNFQVRRQMPFQHRNFLSFQLKTSCINIFSRQCNKIKCKEWKSSCIMPSCYFVWSSPTSTQNPHFCSQLNTKINKCTVSHCLKKIRYMSQKTSELSCSVTRVASSLNSSCKPKYMTLMFGYYCGEDYSNKKREISIRLILFCGSAFLLWLFDL